MYKDLPTILAEDVQYYDTQGVYNRLPREMPLQLGGPSTRRGLTTWLVLGGVALAAGFALALVRRRGIRMVVFGTVALLMALVELYTTWASDPVEMPRHMVGTLSRMSIILVVVIASAVDTAIDAWRTRPPREEPPPAAPPPWEEAFDAEYASQVPPGA